MGKHLKLGTYSFIIDVALLDLRSGTKKIFTREELPEDLKPLYDIIQSNKPCEKSIFVNVIGVLDGTISGFLTQSVGNLFNIVIDDVQSLEINHNTDDTIGITYHVY